MNEQWGYRGRCDTLKRSSDNTVEVVEYKATPVRRRAEVTEPMRMQLALQVAALRAMGHAVTAQSVYFTEHQQRIPVELTDTDFEQAHNLVIQTRNVVDSDTAPEPLIDDRRCTRCSHIAVCLPDERLMTQVTRRIRVADPDAQIVHLTVPGSRASIRQGRLVAVKADEELASIPLERIQGLVVHGNVDLSGALIREMLWRSLTVVWCSSSGRVVGLGELGRRAQRSGEDTPTRRRRCRATGSDPGIHRIKDRQPGHTPSSERIERRMRATLAHPRAPSAKGAQQS